ncbi:glycosyltransferase family 4 protein [Desulfopila sp. IMCC35008]|uniref:glycosyltransferase family 4 protein n=1 Tax=Desulfopila sp. IMCC35008 TaxID=2653858 RepID=UPI0013D078FC|nr:glycosyltransferase family 4 protein [Desulfopila sp. IMCC35008]
MEKLMFNTFIELNRHFRCEVVCPFGGKSSVNKGELVHEVPGKFLPIFYIAACIKSISACRRTRPDIIIGGSGLVSPIVVLLSSLFGSKSVVFVHGLDLVADSFIFKKFFVPTIPHVDFIVANSNNTARLARDIGVLSENITVINPGVEIPNPSAVNPDRLRIWKKQLHIDGHPIMLSVGRLVQRKGIADFVDHGMGLIREKIPNIRFIVIGGEAVNAIRKSNCELAKIKAVIKKRGLEDNVLLLGEVDEATLHLAFSAAELFVFPLVKTHADVEGFGMVAIEAAAFGLPTIAFDEGGVSDAIKENTTGYLISPGDYISFASKAIEILVKSNDYVFQEDGCRQFAKLFSWMNYGKKMQKFIRQIQI